MNKVPSVRDQFLEVEIITGDEVVTRRRRNCYWQGILSPELATNVCGFDIAREVVENYIYHLEEIQGLSERLAGYGIDLTQLLMELSVDDPYRDDEEVFEDMSEPTQVAYVLVSSLLRTMELSRNNAVMSMIDDMDDDTYAQFFEGAFSGEYKNEIIVMEDERCDDPLEGFA